MNDSKILLVFPPVWSPAFVPLGIPSLKAFLEKQGINVEQRDLNVGFWEQFTGDKNLECIYSNMKKYLIQKQPKKNLLKQEIIFYLYVKSVQKNSFEEFKEKVLTKKINQTDFMQLCRKFSSYYTEPPVEIEKSSLVYHDRLFRGISESYYSLSSSKLVEHCKSKSNKFRKYFRELINHDLNKFDFSVIGISVIGANQVVPAFTLASLLKEKFPETHITIGGPWCSHLYDVIPEKKEFFDLVDSIVFFEGENALTQISKSVLENRSLDGIPNIAFRKGEKIIRNEIVCTQNLDEIPTPDFNGLLLEKYQYGSILPLQTSRGCFWGKCIFCSYPFLEPNYKERKIELVVDDIKKLKEKYKVNRVSFVDSSVKISRLEELAKVLIESKIDVKYSCLVRFDKRIIPLLGLLKQSGCLQLVFGLESASPRMLKLINKGINLEDAKKILKETKKVGIKNQICLMYDLPTETIDDTAKTLDFLRENIETIDSFIYSKFGPEKHTLVEQQQEQLGIKFEKNPEFDLDLGYVFKSDTMTKKELERIEKEFYELLLWCKK